MNRLASDAKGVADLLPGPSGSSSRCYLNDLESVGKTSQGDDRSQPHCRILTRRREGRAVEIHACHPRLTNAIVSMRVDTEASRLKLR